MRGFQHTNSQARPTKWAGEDVIGLIGAITLTLTMTLVFILEYNGWI